MSPPHTHTTQKVHWNPKSHFFWLFELIWSGVFAYFFSVKMGHRKGLHLVWSVSVQEEEHLDKELMWRLWLPRVFLLEISLYLVFWSLEDAMRIINWQYWMESGPDYSLILDLGFLQICRNKFHGFQSLNLQCFMLDARGSSAPTLSLCLPFS